VNAKKSISLIVAMDENRLIGRGNGLPWRLPNDLKHFKMHTLGKTILMGRKTWDTLGKPLPQREHWVLTRDPAFCAEHCRKFTNIDSVLASHTSGELMVVGGGEIYRLMLPYIDRFYLTLVHAREQGDAWFPPYDPRIYHEATRIDQPADERHRYAYSFITLDRIRPE
jgi:dihydrofolate reductase